MKTLSTNWRNPKNWSLQSKIKLSRQQISFLKVFTTYLLFFRWDISKNIGSGNFGSVYKCKINGNDVAVKRLNLFERDKHELETNFRKESEVF